MGRILERIIESNKLSRWIAGELKIMDQNWLKELNTRNLAFAGEDSSQWDFATVSLSSSVLSKLSQEEQEKFKISELQEEWNECWKT